MVTPNTLTSRYLAEVAERGDRAARLVQLAREKLDLAATSYDGDCLTKPVTRATFAAQGTMAWTAPFFLDPGSGEQPAS